MNGVDLDSTMLRVGTLNMLLPGIEHPDTRGLDLVFNSDTIRSLHRLGIDERVRQS